MIPPFRRQLDQRWGFTNPKENDLNLGVSIHNPITALFMSKSKVTKVKTSDGTTIRYNTKSLAKRIKNNNQDQGLKTDEIDAIITNIMARVTKANTSAPLTEEQFIKQLNFYFNCGLVSADTSADLPEKLAKYQQLQKQYETLKPAPDSQKNFQEITKKLEEEVANFVQVNPADKEECSKVIALLSAFPENEAFMAAKASLEADLAEKEPTQEQEVEPPNSEEMQTMALSLLDNPSREDCFPLIAQMAEYPEDLSLQVARLNLEVAILQADTETSLPEKLGQLREFETQVRDVAPDHEDLQLGLVTIRSQIETQLPAHVAALESNIQKRDQSAIADATEMVSHLSSIPQSPVTQKSNLSLEIALLKADTNVSLPERLKTYQRLQFDLILLESDPPENAQQDLTEIGSSLEKEVREFVNQLEEEEPPTTLCTQLIAELSAFPDHRDFQEAKLQMEIHTLRSDQNTTLPEKMKQYQQMQIEILSLDPPSEDLQKRFQVASTEVYSAFMTQARNSIDDLQSDETLEGDRAALEAAKRECDTLMDTFFELKEVIPIEDPLFDSGLQILRALSADLAGRLVDDVGPLQQRLEALSGDAGEQYYELYKIEQEMRVLLIAKPNTPGLDVLQDKLIAKKAKLEEDLGLSKLGERERALREISRAVQGNQYTKKNLVLVNDVLDKILAEEPTGSDKLRAQLPTLLAFQTRAYERTGEKPELERSQQTVDLLLRVYDNQSWNFTSDFIITRDLVEQLTTAGDETTGIKLIEFQAKRLDAEIAGTGIRKSLDTQAARLFDECLRFKARFPNANLKGEQVVRDARNVEQAPSPGKESNRAMRAVYDIRHEVVRNIGQKSVKAISDAETLWCLTTFGLDRGQDRKEMDPIRSEVLKHLNGNPEHLKRFFLEQRGFTETNFNQGLQDYNDLFEKPFNIPRQTEGLANLGCTCYMNAVLQSVRTDPGFRRELKLVVQTEEGSDYALAKAFDDLFEAMETGGQPLSREDMRTFFDATLAAGWLKDERGNLTGQMQDAYEFMTEARRYMGTASAPAKLEQTTTRTIGGVEQPASIAFTADQGVTTELPDLNNVNRGLQFIRDYKSAHSDAKQEDIFKHLVLDNYLSVPNARVAIQKYEENEDLSSATELPVISPQNLFEWNMQNMNRDELENGQIQEMRQERKMASAPQTLYLNIKRNIGWDGARNPARVNTTSPIVVEDKDGRTLTYEPVSVMIHDDWNTNSMNTGHYTALSKQDNEWQWLNDRSVTTQDNVETAFFQKGASVIRYQLKEE